MLFRSWDRDRVLQEITVLTTRPGADLVRGAHGMAEGVPPHLRDANLPKFRAGGLLITYAGGGAGLFSSMVAGWANGSVGSEPVTRAVGS